MIKEFYVGMPFGFEQDGFPTYMILGKKDQMVVYKSLVFIGDNEGKPLIVEEAYLRKQSKLVEHEELLY